MPEWLVDFHLLRPWWLLAIPVGIVWVAISTKRRVTTSGWAGVIAPSLLPFLTHSIRQENTRRRTAWLLTMIWILACLGLAGPTATRLPQPLQRDTNALVVVFDLSPSMRVQDLVPDRLTRARLKTIDLLRERRGGMTGLVVYAGDAFAVVPMTPDVNTILHLIPELEPEIMPSPGSHVEAALRQGIELLIAAGHRTGRLLLVTDSVSSDAQQNVGRLMRQFGEYRLDIFGIGTSDGGPIPLSDGSFARDSNNRVVMASLPEQRLRNLARRAGGRYATLTPDDRDLDHLLTPYRTPASNITIEHTQQEFDLWHDLGYWFALALLPLIVLVFRRGTVVSLVLLIPLGLNAPSATASSWEGLWRTPDQRASQALTEGDPKLAQELFRDPAWQAVAAYQAGDYKQAEELFGHDDSASGHYNRGNTLAAQGQFAEAIDAYDKALTHNPQLESARHNRDRATELLQQQQSEQSPSSAPQTEASEAEAADHEPSSPEDQVKSAEDEGGGEAGSTQAEPGESDEGGHSDASQSASPQSPSESSDSFGSQADPMESMSGEPAIADDEDLQTDESAEHEKGTADDTPSDAGDATPADASANTSDSSHNPAEERMEQGLRRVPDDPGGLLRRQLQREALLRARQSQRAQSPPPGTKEDRW